MQVKGAKESGNLIAAVALKEVISIRRTAAPDGALSHTETHMGHHHKISETSGPGRKHGRGWRRSDSEGCTQMMRTISLFDFSAAYPNTLVERPAGALSPALLRSSRVWQSESGKRPPWRESPFSWVATWAKKRKFLSSGTFLGGGDALHRQRLYAGIPSRDCVA